MNKSRRTGRYAALPREISDLEGKLSKHEYERLPDRARTSFPTFEETLNDTRETIASEYSARLEDFLKYNRGTTADHGRMSDRLLGVHLHGKPKMPLDGPYDPSEASEIVGYLQGLATE